MNVLANAVEKFRYQIKCVTEHATLAYVITPTKLHILTVHHQRAQQYQRIRTDVFDEFEYGEISMPLSLANIGSDFGLNYKIIR